MPRSSHVCQEPMNSTHSRTPHNTGQRVTSPSHNHACLSPAPDGEPQGSQEGKVVTAPSQGILLLAQEWGVKVTACKKDRVMQRNTDQATPVLQGFAEYGSRQARARVWRT